MDELIKAVHKYNSGTYLRIEWRHGEVIVEGVIDCFFETNNGLEEDEEGYREYYACYIQITNVIKVVGGSKFIYHSFAEVSSEYEPTLITLEDGRVIWKK